MFIPKSKFISIEGYKQGRVLSMSLGVFNLWLVFVPGYALIWLAMLWINRKRPRPVEDPAIYQVVGRRKMVWFGFYPQLSLLVASCLVPIQPGARLWIGLPLALMGIALNILCFRAFAPERHTLATTGLYRFSRNPMYVSGLLLILGLNVMGANLSGAYGLFLVLTLAWVAGTHWCVLQEEKFLAGEYGEAYVQYRHRVPRYL